MGIKDPKILTGANEQMREMSNTALVHQAELTDIFAEVEPNQKERIINMLKKAGNVVGFMGDGINDAPALHTADVGISVNTAVDVAKEAADIVLLDQDLDVLYEGIIEGRKTFTNTMKYIFMATSANPFGNMFSMAGASLFFTIPALVAETNIAYQPADRFPGNGYRHRQRRCHQYPNTRSIGTLNFISPLYGDLWLAHLCVLIMMTFGVLLFIMHAKEHLFQTGWFVESVLSAILIVLVVAYATSFCSSKACRASIYQSQRRWYFCLCWLSR